MAEGGGVALEIATVLSVSGDLPEILASIGEAFTALETKSSALQDSISAIAASIDQIGDSFLGASREVTPLETAIDGILTTAKEVGSGITEALGGAFMDAGIGIQSFKDAITGIDTSFTGIVSASQKASNDVATQWESAASRVQAAARSIDTAGGGGGGGALKADPRSVYGPPDQTIRDVRNQQTDALNYGPQLPTNAQIQKGMRDDRRQEEQEARDQATQRAKDAIINLDPDYIQQAAIRNSQQARANAAIKAAQLEIKRQEDPLNKEFDAHPSGINPFSLKALGTEYSIYEAAKGASEIVRGTNVIGAGLGLSPEAFGPDHQLKPEFYQAIQEGPVKHAREGTVFSMAETTLGMEPLAARLVPQTSGLSDMQKIQYLDSMAPMIQRVAELNAQRGQGSLLENETSYARTLEAFGANTPQSAQPLINELYRMTQATGESPEAASAGLSLSAAPALSLGIAPTQIMQDVSFLTNRLGPSRGPVAYENMANAFYRAKVVDPNDEPDAVLRENIKQEVARRARGIATPADDLMEKRFRQKRVKENSTAKALQGLGLIDDQGLPTAAARDDKGVFSMDAVMRSVDTRLANAHEGTPQFFKVQQEAEQAFGVRGFRGFVGEGEAGFEDKLKAFQEHYNNQMNAEDAQKMLYNDPLGQFKEMNSLMADIGSTMGLLFLPRLRDLLNVVNSGLSVIPDSIKNSPVTQGGIDLLAGAGALALFIAAVKYTGQTLYNFARGTARGVRGTVRWVSNKAGRVRQLMEGEEPAVGETPTAPPEAAAPSARQAATSVRSPTEPVPPRVVTPEASTPSASQAATATRNAPPEFSPPKTAIPEAAPSAGVTAEAGEAAGLLSGVGGLLRIINPALLGYSAYEASKDVLAGSGPEFIDSQDKKTQVRNPDMGLVGGVEMIWDWIVHGKNPDDTAVRPIPKADDKTIAIPKGLDQASKELIDAAHALMDAAIALHNQPRTTGSVTPPASVIPSITPNQSPPNAIPPTPQGHPDPAAMGIPFSQNQPIKDTGFARLAMNDTGIASDVPPNLFDNEATPSVIMPATSDTSMPENQTSAINSSMPSINDLPPIGDQGIAEQLPMPYSSFMYQGKIQQPPPRSITAQPLPAMTSKDDLQTTLQGQLLNPNDPSFSNQNPGSPASTFFNRTDQSIYDNLTKFGNYSPLHPMIQHQHITHPPRVTVTPMMQSVARGEGQYIPPHYSATSGSSAPGSLPPADAQGRAKQAMAFFESKGRTPEQAAGIVANLMKESGMRETAKGDSGQALGIAQWHGDRRAALEKAGYKVEGGSFLDQLKAVDYEMTEGNEKSVGAMLSKAKTAADAGAIISKYYERPRDTMSEMALRGASAERGLKDWAPDQSMARIPDRQRLTDTNGPDFARYGYLTSMVNQPQEFTHNNNTYLDGELVAQNTVKHIVTNSNSANRGITGFDAAMTPSMPGPVVRHQ